MKRASLLPVLLLLWLSSALPVFAHANLVRSDPPPNSVLPVPPASVSLWFDEDLDPQFSTVTVLDSRQARVDADNQIVSADHREMSVGLRPGLPPGAYTVSWRAFSAADGHVTRGAYAIFVGAASAGQPVPLNLASTEAGVLPLPVEIVVRWFNLVAALALCGALTLALLAGDADADFRTMRAAINWRMRVWIVVNLIILFVGTIAAQLLQAMAASERGLGDVLAQSIWLQTLTGTRFGQAGLARIVLVDLLLVLYAAGGAESRRRWSAASSRGPLSAHGHEARAQRRLGNARLTDLLYWGLSALILLSFSLASHDAASSQTVSLGLAADWLHLLAIGAWTGGLFALALVLRPALAALPDAGRRRTVLVLLRRFSNVSVAAVALFALTGLYALWRQVGYPDALVATPYGLTLIIKNVMLVPLLLIGAINTLLLRPDLLARVASWKLGFGGRAALPSLPFVPRLEALASSSRLPSSIVRLVRIEAVLGALVVLAAAALTALPPARTAVPPPLPPPFDLTRQASDLKVSLHVDPYVVGNQAYEVKVVDLQGNPAPNVLRVTLRFTFLGTDLGTATGEMQPAGAGVYRLQGGFLSVVGAWQVNAVIRRQDIEQDVTVPYRLDVADPASSVGAEVPPLSASLVFAILDLIVGVAVLVIARRRNIPEGKWIGLGALALGIVLCARGTVLAPAVAANLVTNPIVPDETSLARGKVIYEARCAVCHGATGRGNGPLAITMNPQPADFVAHVNQHPDDVLFNWVSKGIAGTGMPSWESILTETDRWDVINYIQALADRANATPTPPGR